MSSILSVKFTYFLHFYEILLLLLFLLYFLFLVCDAQYHYRLLICDMLYLVQCRQLFKRFLFLFLILIDLSCAFFSSYDSFYNTKKRRKTTSSNNDHETQHNLLWIQKMRLKKSKYSFQKKNFMMKIKYPIKAE